MKRFNPIGNTNPDVIPGVIRGWWLLWHKGVMKSWCIKSSDAAESHNSHNFTTLSSISCYSSKLFLVKILSVAGPSPVHINTPELSGSRTKHNSETTMGSGHWWLSASKCPMISLHAPHPPLCTSPCQFCLFWSEKSPAPAWLRIMRLCNDIPGIEFQRTGPVPI